MLMVCIDMCMGVCGVCICMYVCMYICDVLELVRSSYDWHIICYMVHRAPHCRTFAVKTISNAASSTHKTFVCECYRGEDVETKRTL